MKTLIPFVFALFIFTSPLQSGETKDEAKALAYTEALDLFNGCALQSCIDFEVFEKSYQGYLKFKPKKPILVICDFSKPSNEKRFFVIDLFNKKLLHMTYVAHGKNSGELFADSFSNEPESYKSCTGFLSINERINSPKHGAALLLEGLEKNVNDNACKREIIIHGADYVSEDFIAKNGRLGRSYGCPALPIEEMEIIIPYISEGALLFINAK
jgi:hypothetical protein